LFWRICSVRGESTYVISGLLPSGRAPDPQRTRSLVNGLPFAPEVSVFSSLTDIASRDRCAVPRWFDAVRSVRSVRA
jgi:hypothetical protein